MSAMTNQPTPEPARTSNGWRPVKIVEHPAFRGRPRAGHNLRLPVHLRLVSLDRPTVGDPRCALYS